MSQTMTFNGDIGGFIRGPIKALMVWFGLALVLTFLVGMSSPMERDAATILTSDGVYTLVNEYVQVNPIISVAHVLFIIASVFIVAWLITAQLKYLVAHTQLNGQSLAFSGSPTGLVYVLFFTTLIALALTTIILLLSRILNTIHPALLGISIVLAVIAEFYIIAWAIRRFALWFVHDLHIVRPHSPIFSFKGTTWSIMKVLILFSVIYAVSIGVTLSLMFNLSHAVETGTVGSVMNFWINMGLLGVMFFVAALTGPFLITQILKYFASNTQVGGRSFVFTGQAAQLLIVFFVVFMVGGVLFLGFSLLKFLFSWFTLIYAFINLIFFVAQILFIIWVILAIYSWIIRNLQLPDAVE